MDRAIGYLVDGHVEEGVSLAIEKYAPSAKENEQKIVEIMEKEFVPHLWQSSNTDTHGFGYSDLTRYEEYIQLLTDYGLIEKSYPAAELAVNMEAKK